MTKRQKSNMAHSVHQRLLNEARSTGRPFNELLQYYAMERFLYRLSCTVYKENMLLKGALLLRAWGLPHPRSTMDIDMMSQRKFPPSYFKEIVNNSMAVPADDGLTFHPNTIVTEAIDNDAEYQGWRILFKANLGNARINLQMDVGIEDTVFPSPVWIKLPTLLDFPAPRLKAYTPESAIAEKFNAMIILGKANSRMKDYYDLRILASNLNFKGIVLRSAIEKTFQRRGTAIPGITPVALTSEFNEDPIKQSQWKAFLRRLPGQEAGLDFGDTINIIKNFIMPAVISLNKGIPFESEWPPGGPWK